ncbi:MAG: hypothetical protein MUC92_10805 [Fimbriimonadaceae bacterium]|nr:hypothetical protein [Fimbriimonadaceae bacterium]
MTRDQQNHLAEEIERLVRNDQPAFERRVQSWIAGGYSYFAGLSVLCILLILFLILFMMEQGRPRFTAIFFMGLSATLLYVMVRAVLAKPEIQKGIILNQETHPELFNSVRLVSEKVEGPAIHRIVLAPSFNAGTLIYKTNGWFGKIQYDLMIGLPLMMGLTKEDIDVVICHEIVKYSARDGTVFGKLEVSIQNWITALEETMRLSFAGWPAFTFASWYIQRLQTIAGASYPEILRRTLIRTAEVLTNEKVVVSMVRTAVVSSLLAKRFDTTWKPTSRHQIDPPNDIFVRFHQQAQSTFGPKFGGALRRVLNEVPTEYDASPTLSDQLRHLGYRDQEVISLMQGMDQGQQVSAATFYLGRHLEGYSEQLGKKYAENRMNDWNAMVEEFDEASDKLLELEAKMKREPLTAEEVLELAYSYNVSGQKEKALAMVQDCREKNPSDPDAMLALGMLLADDLDEECVALLTASSTYRATTTAALTRLSDYYYEIGNHQLAANALDRLRDFQDELYQFTKTLWNLEPPGDWEPAQFPRYATKLIAETCAKFDAVQSVHCIRRTHKTEEAVELNLVVFIIAPPGLFKLGKDYDGLVNQLREITLPSGFVGLASKTSDPGAMVLMNQADSKIYQKGFVPLDPFGKKPANCDSRDSQSPG